MTMAMQELTVSCKLVSVSAVAVNKFRYLQFEENRTTQNSYNHLKVQTFLGIDY